MGALRHGTNSFYIHGCRCAECTAAHAEYSRQYNAKNKDKLRAARERAKQTPFEDIPHGSLNGYHYYSCRCVECKSAERTYRENNKDKRIANLEKLKQDGKTPHGTYTGYATYGCRCPLCTKAKREYARKYEEANHERLQAYRAEYLALKKTETPWSDIPHGTTRGYNTYGCRCSPCRAAKAEYARERSQAKESRSETLEKV